MAEMQAAVLQKDRSLVVQINTRPQIIPGSSIDKVRYNTTLKTYTQHF